MLKTFYPGFIYASYRQRTIEQPLVYIFCIKYGSPYKLLSCSPPIWQKIWPFIMSFLHSYPWGCFLCYWGEVQWNSRQACRTPHFSKNVSRQSCIGIDKAKNVLLVITGTSRSTLLGKKKSVPRNKFISLWRQVVTFQNRWMMSILKAWWSGTHPLCSVVLPALQTCTVSHDGSQITRSVGNYLLCLCKDF